jgi:hypothetical protein
MSKKRTNNLPVILGKPWKLENSVRELVIKQIFEKAGGSKKSLKS